MITFITILYICNSSVCLTYTDPVLLGVAEHGIIFGRYGKRILKKKDFSICMKSQENVKFYHP